MIKKPQAPTLADFLRADQEKIDQKYKALADYKQKVFNELAKEFKTEDAYELAIRLAEKYHEPFQRKEKQGRKKKWTPQIEAMLAVCVDFREEDDEPSSITDEIDWLLDATLWSKFSKKGNEIEVIGTDNLRKHYNAGKKAWNTKLKRNGLIKTVMYGYKDYKKPCLKGKTIFYFAPIDL